jgi:transposase
MYLNGIFWVLRSGAPWRDIPTDFGPYTTCYNRFVRWRRAGVWARLMSALADAHDAAVQMIDTSIVRVHQHGACITRNRQQSMGRSRGGLTSKIHALVDTNGLPVRLALTAGEAHDNRLAGKLLSRLKSGAMLLADRGYDAVWIRTLATEKGAWANIPPRSNRNDPICFSPYRSNPPRERALDLWTFLKGEKPEFSVELVALALVVKASVPNASWGQDKRPDFISGLATVADLALAVRNSALAQC